MPDPAALARTLDARRREIAALDAVAGFDGFVDEMIAVVAERRGLDAWTPMAAMADLGRVVSAAAGGNALREIVVRSQDAGGCAVNLGDTLAALGVRLDYFGTVGQPRHAAFDAFAARCRTCTAWGSSFGRTLAFEFGDGKFMFSAVEQLGELTPELLVTVTDDGAFARACAAAKLIAITNWTLYPHMTACWRWLQEHVLAALPQRPWLFLDLVDPSGRAESDIRAMLGAAGIFARSCRVVLGLNRTEAAVVARVLGVPAAGDDATALAQCAADLRTWLGLTEVVIHGKHRNIVADAQGVLAVPAGPFCAVPLKSTGAGDRFNAGYCLGLMLELSAADRLDLGSATSGFFIRNARSGSLDEVIGFLRGWAAGALAAR